MKKMIVADQFAQMADAYFADPGAAQGYLGAWGGVLAFTMQIFFDFSGYTDTAIGCAALFGFQFPENFRRPYLAGSITEFWRRWHISLSQWLRDYLYISLGGNRRHTYRNLILTMLLGGLWHGASWNFVIWGGYHGVLLAFERATKLRPSAPVTFVLVAIGWVFFRAVTLGDALYITGQLVTAPPGRFGWSPWMLRLAIATALLAFAEERWQWFDRVARARPLPFAAAVAAMLLGIELFGVTGVTIPFVYFQF